MSQNAAKEGQQMLKKPQKGAAQGQKPKQSAKKQSGQYEQPHLTVPGVKTMAQQGEKKDGGKEKIQHRRQTAGPLPQHPQQIVKSAQKKAKPHSCGKLDGLQANG